MTTQWHGILHMHDNATHGIPPCMTTASAAGRSGPHHRRQTAYDNLVLERTDSMGSVGPDDVNPLEHDVATPDKQLGAVSGSSWGPHSGLGTPSDRYSGGWSADMGHGSTLAGCGPAVKQQEGYLCWLVCEPAMCNLAYWMGWALMAQQACPPLLPGLHTPWQLASARIPHSE
jgi:hypothetical protein